MKHSLRKGADPSIILEIFNENQYLKEMDSIGRKNETKKLYSRYFSTTSKETIKSNIREDIVVRNQKNRFISKVPQDLMKLDLIAAHYDEKDDTIYISLIQQKVNNASFNSTSESKTIESISNCNKLNYYMEYFNLLPDGLNPIKSNKKYVIDFCIGMVNAVGSKESKKNDIKIKYLTNDEYLLYLGIEIDIVELAYQISKEEKIINHEYNAVDQCENWDYIYEKCQNRYYDRI